MCIRDRDNIKHSEEHASGNNSDTDVNINVDDNANNNENDNESSAVRDITIIVNNGPVTLSGKSNYILVDLFQFYEFDLSKPKGNIVILLNGETCEYTASINAVSYTHLYYDAEIFKDIVLRKDAEKDARFKSRKIDLSHDMIQPEKARRFSRNHGLPANDAAFFNESEILRELAEKEDFIVIGRCADVILKNNNIPHISVFITAPVEQRAKRIMELEKIPYSKALKRLVKFDKKREKYYKFYTNNVWGQAYNCLLYTSRCV